MSKNSAFSLIELMIVVAIIGFLAAVSVPSYYNYRNKAQISTAIHLLSMMNESVKNIYDTQGVIPNSIIFDGVTFSAGQHVAYSSASTARLHYHNLSTPSSDMWMNCAYVTGLKDISLYVDPVEGPPLGLYSRVCSKVVAANNMFYTYCGNWDSSGTVDIPTANLPSGCRCNALWGWNSDNLGTSNCSY